MAPDPARQPAGTKTGGQYAASGHAESDVTIDDPWETTRLADAIAQARPDLFADAHIRSARLAVASTDYEDGIDEDGRIEYRTDYGPATYAVTVVDDNGLETEITVPPAELELSALTARSWPDAVQAIVDKHRLRPVAWERFTAVDLKPTRIDHGACATCENSYAGYVVTFEPPADFEVPKRWKYPWTVEVQASDTMCDLGHPGYLPEDLAKLLAELG